MSGVGPSGLAFSGDAQGFVARYTTAGALDATFDGDGIALFDPGAGQELAMDLGIQPDGKVVIAGDPRRRHRHGALSRVGGRP